MRRHVLRRIWWYIAKRGNILASKWKKCMAGNSPKERGKEREGRHSKCLLSGRLRLCSMMRACVNTLKPENYIRVEILRQCIASWVAKVVQQTTEYVSRSKQLKLRNGENLRITKFHPIQMPPLPGIVHRSIRADPYVREVSPTNPKRCKCIP